MSGVLLERACRLLATWPVLDGHNDLVWELRQRVSYDLDRLDLSRPQPDLQTDLPRLRAGGVGAQFWSVYVPSSLQGDHAVSATLEQVDAARRLVRHYPDALALALCADDVELARRSGRVASLLGAEGGTRSTARWPPCACCTSWGCATSPSPTTTTCPGPTRPLTSRAPAASPPSAARWSGR